MFPTENNPIASANGPRMVPPSRKSGTERGRDEPHASSPIEDREAGAERCRHENRPAEDVLGLLTPSLARGRTREQHSEDRRREEEADSCEGRRGSVRPCIVSREAGLDDQQIDVRQQGDADEAHRDRPEIPQKRSQIDSRPCRTLGERSTDQPERERRAKNRARGRRQNCCTEAIARCRGDREEPESQEERNDVQGGERMEALAALKHAHRNGRDERRDEACLGEDDDTGRVDVEQVHERYRQHKRKHDERHGADEREPERPSCERVSACGVARSEAPRHLARDRHLQGLRRDEDDGQQSEQGRERAVPVAAE